MCKPRPNGQSTLAKQTTYVVSHKLIQRYKTRHIDVLETKKNETGSEKLSKMLTIKRGCIPN